MTVLSYLDTRKGTDQTTFQSDPLTEASLYTNQRPQCLAIAISHKLVHLREAESYHSSTYSITSQKVKDHEQRQQTSRYQHRRTDQKKLLPHQRLKRKSSSVSRRTLNKRACNQKSLRETRRPKISTLSKHQDRSLPPNCSEVMRRVWPKGRKVKQKKCLTSTLSQRRPKETSLNFSYSPPKMAKMSQELQVREGRQCRRE